MKLTSKQQQQWNLVTSVFTALSRTVHDAAALEAEMATWITEFETSMGNEVKVKIRMLPAPSIDLVDCSKDYLRLNRDEQGASTLRARVEGILINSTIAYKENYKHSNGAVVDALRSLADSIEKLPVELRDQGQDGVTDIYSLLGVTHSAAVIEEEVEDEAPADEAQAQPPADADEDEALISLFSGGDDDQKA